MLEFDYIEVLKTYDNFHYIAWSPITAAVAQVYPIPPENDPKQYYYVVYWSNDPMSGFHSIKNRDGTDVHIDGDTDNLELSVKHYRKHYNFNNKYYYVIVAYHKTIPELAIKSEQVYYGKFSDGVHVQIKHAEDTLYTMYYGEPALIIKRKSYGEPCPNCWSEERQQRTKSNCSVCNGTGKLFGYYQPIQVQMSFDSDPVKSDVQKNYEVVTDTKRGRISNYPIVRPRDLIVNLDDNKRYVITHVETTKLPLRAMLNTDKTKRLSNQNYVVSQMLSLQEVPADDQEYFMNYNNIPIECEDYSLPRFETHPPADGEAPITVDENQIVRLNYGDDFSVDENGKLVLNNPLEKTGILSIDYIFTEGFSTDTIISSVTNNLIPDAVVETKVSSISMSTNKVGNLNDINPAVVRLATIPVNRTDEYTPGDGTTVLLYNFLNKNEFQGVKYYVYFNVEATSGTPIVTPNEAMYVEIIPNDSWAFEWFKVTVELELRMA